MIFVCGYGYCCDKITSFIGATPCDTTQVPNFVVALLLHTSWYSLQFILTINAYSSTLLFLGKIFSCTGTAVMLAAAVCICWGWCIISYVLGCVVIFASAQSRFLSEVRDHKKKKCENEIEMEL